MGMILRSLTLAFTISAVAAPLATAQADENIRILSPTWPGFAPVLVADDLGYFKEEGITIDMKFEDRGYDVQVGMFKFGVLARARIAGDTEGFVKIVSEKKYDEVLGVHLIGGRSTELVAEATLALRLECTVEELIRTIHAHPTMSEAVGEAAHAAHGAAIHV